MNNDRIIGEINREREKEGEREREREKGTERVRKMRKRGYNTKTNYFLYI